MTPITPHPKCKEISDIIWTGLIAKCRGQLPDQGYEIVGGKALTHLERKAWNDYYNRQVMKTQSKIEDKFGNDSYVIDKYALCHAGEIQLSHFVDDIKNNVFMKQHITNQFCHLSKYLLGYDGVPDVLCERMITAWLSGYIPCGVVLKNEQVESLKVWKIG
jgi:hypothetical protein